MSGKIESLTAKQEARIPEFVEKWTQIGLSTDPADRPRAERAIAEMYARAGLAAPRKIVWCGSPLSQMLTHVIVLDPNNRDTIEARVVSSVWADITADVAESIGMDPGYGFKTHIEHNVLVGVHADIRSCVGESVRDAVQSNIQDWVWDTISDGVSVWDSVTVGLEGVKLYDSFNASVGGQHSAAVLAAGRYYHDVLGLTAETEKLSGLWELAQSAFSALPHENICWVCERHHHLALDDDAFLHSLVGPACAYPDGFAIHAVHGVRVPEFVVERPREITIQTIDNEGNAEVRRVMIDRYRVGENVHGAAAFMRDAGGVRVDHDESFGTLWRREVADDEPIVLLEVINATSEPDGQFKHYFLRVPPTMTTAREAAAWTFDRAPEDYAPSIET
jgi:hypothetical protein